MCDQVEKLRIALLRPNFASNCCIFCLKNTLPTKLNTDVINNLLKLFLNLVERYFDEGGVIKDVQFDLSICEDCEIIVESWTAIYHKIKCLEMELEWKILKLKDVMSLANRVPTRMSFLKECYHDEEKITGVREWRQNLIRNCKQKLSMRGPKVSLFQLDGDDGTSVVSGTNIDKKAAPDESQIEFKQNENDFSVDDQIMGIDISPVFCVKSDSHHASISHTKFTSENGQLSNVAASTVAIKVESAPLFEPVRGAEVKIDAKGVCPEPKEHFDHASFPAEDLPAQAMSAIKNGDISSDIHHPRDLLITDTSSTVAKKSEDVSHYQSQDESNPCYLNITKAEHDPSRSNSISNEPIYDIMTEKVKVHLQSNTLSQSPPPKTPSTFRLRSRFPCSKCGKTFLTLDKLKSHEILHRYANTEINSDHSDMESEEEWIGDGDTTDTSEGGKISDECDDAENVKNPSTSEIQIKEDNRKTFPCDKCGRKFSKSGHVRHSQAFPGNKCLQFCCYFCGKACHNERKLEYHMTSHTKEKPYFCRYCDESFVWSRTLTVHTLMKHSDDLESPPSSDSRNNQDSGVLYNADEELHRFYRIEVKSKQGKSSWFRCGVCKHKFKHKHGFIDHYTMHHKLTSGKKAHKCCEDNCSAYFVQPHQLHLHTVIYHGKKGSTGTKLFSCSICSKRFMNLSLLRRHKKTHHDDGNGESEKVLRCECDLNKCKAYFLTAAQLSNHVHICHSKSEVKPNYLCDTCPARLSSLQGHHHHCAAQHNQEFSKVSKVTYYHQSEDGQNINIPKRRRCYLILPGNSNVCSICGCKFSHRQGYLRHQRTHHLRIGGDTIIHNCDHQGCSAYFRTKLQLRNHMIFAHPLTRVPKVFKCEYCGKKLKNLLALSQHRLSSHKNELIFLCSHEGCDKKYATEKQLSVHLKFGHLGPRQICPTCGKNCFSEKTFARHLKSHEEDKPKRTYFCDLCGKQFKSVPILSLHRLSHSGPDSWEFQCSTCGKKCMTQQKLDEHMRTHTKEKPFICQYCGEKYAHNHNLRNHLKSKHGDVINCQKQGPVHLNQ